MLGCDGKDNIYLQSLNDLNKVYVLDRGNSITSISLQDSGYSQIYSDKQDLYAVYNDRIVSLSSGDKASELFDPQNHFIGMGGSNIYFLDASGFIVTVPMNI